MPPFDEVSYSESACIAAITDYYKLLISMYLDETYVEWPPEGGWPQITPGAFGVRGKSDKVISLLRQIPYLRELDTTDEWEQPHGVPYDNFCNWKNEFQNGAGGDSWQISDLKMMTEGYYFDGTTEHMIGLMIGGRNATFAIIDTQYGIVYWPECDDTISNESKQERVWGEPEEISCDKEGNLRCEPAWTINDFFTMLREQLLDLKWLPINSRQVVGPYTEWDEDSELQSILKGIYWGHGWPDEEEYKKEECIRLIEQTTEERCPDFSLA
ncbi:hypothetical protein DE146DRAFT_647450 [Phaeosphaeria sp. MPI-PUGE-AT-0046c]|nr:hypothetical protein DE146DRAFT_647450 [Phaeosphaeria sp. MPI-PUGE-AT-0046c]